VPRRATEAGGKGQRGGHLRGPVFQTWPRPRLSAIAAEVEDHLVLRFVLTLGFVLAASGLQAQQSFTRTFIVSAMRGLDCQLTEDQAPSRVLQPLGLT
jgi:hypothetical protein